MINRQPLHAQIATLMREEIRTKHQPGDRLESESKLAKRFEVSIVTMREAMLKLSQERLVERRHGSGTYVLADQPVGTRTVGLLVSQSIMGMRASYFFLRLTKTLQDLFATRDIAVRLFLGQFDDRKSPETMVGQELSQALTAGEIQGLVAISITAPSHWVDFVSDLGIPIVGGGETYDVGVHTDHAAMVKAGTEFLLDHGRRRIAFLHWHTSPGQLENNPFFHHFMATLEDRGVPLFGSHPSGIDPTQAGGGWGELRDLWQNGPDRPDGLLVCDDVLYREAAPALLSLGVKVPEALLVVTHANKDSDVFYPFPTARLEYDPDRFAAATADLLCALMDGAPVERPGITLPFAWQGVDEVEAALATVSKPSR